MKPTVSIIIPCYNQAQFLPDAINSLKAQTMSDWECIIVNDGSSDNTASVGKILTLSDPRIFLINQENHGLSGARNSGLSRAKGLYIQFLDADDKLEPNKLKTQLKYLEDNPSIDIVFGDARYFTTQNPSLRKYGINKNKSWIPERWQSSGTLIEKLLNYNLFPVNSPLIKSHVFKIVGQWNVNLAAHEDWEFWLRCAIKNLKLNYHKSPNSLALIRMHPESMTNDASRMQQSSLKMRITIGYTLKDPALRLLNFKMGLYQLQSTKPDNTIIQLLKLLRSNLALKTVHTGSIFFLEYVIPKQLINSYKKIVPWTLQKKILKILQLKTYK